MASVRSPSGSSAPAQPGGAPEPQLSTGDGRANLKRRSVRSGVITIAAQIAQVGLGIAGTMILARLLTPADFGLLAMVSSLLAFVGSFRDWGFPVAAVHREGLEHRQISALFWISMRLNIGVSLFIIAMAPVLAWFYDERELLAITPVLAIGVFVLSLSTLHEALLQRQMRFGTLTGIELGSVVASIAAGVGAALLGAGYWALVAQTMVLSAGKGLALWAATGWRPARSAWRQSSTDQGLRAMLTYGRDVTGARVLTHIGRNLDRVVVGRIAGANALGLYSSSYKWSLLPVQQVHLSLYRVAVSALSRLQNDPERYRAFARIALLPLFAFPMPALAFLFVRAREVILVLLGEQWLDAVPLFRILCISAFAYGTILVTKWLYLSGGDTQRQLRWNYVSTPVMVAAVAIGARWGAIGVAWGFTAGTLLLSVPGVAYCLKTSHLRMRDFAAVVWRPAVASVGAAALLRAGESLWPVGVPLVEVVTHFAIFAVAYLLLWMGLPGGRAATADVVRVLTELRGKGRAKG